MKVLKIRASGPRFNDRVDKNESIEVNEIFIESFWPITLDARPGVDSS